MSAALRRLPSAVLVAAAVAMMIHGPIGQPASYHDFADRRFFCGSPNGADVWSNLAFGVVGAWGCWLLRSRDARAALGPALPGYAIFVASLVLTAAGSGYYHYAPDNARLVWDRLPIALACAGLLAGARAATVAPAQPRWTATALAIFGAATVIWWYCTEQAGRGDLRAYVLLQGAPLVVIPLWQAVARAPKVERLGFGGAVLLYVAAKACELNDRAIFESLGFVGGHTLKHLLAAAASLAITASLVAPRIARKTI